MVRELYRISLPTAIVRLAKDEIDSSRSLKSLAFCCRGFLSSGGSIAAPRGLLFQQALLLEPAASIIRIQLLKRIQHSYY
jgi:hypothetical protein